MKQRHRLGILAALLCVGCGGSPSDPAGTESNFLGLPYYSDGAGGGTFGPPMFGTPPNPPTVPIATQSPFTGQFVGTWTAPSDGETGTADIVVTATGSLTGTLHDSQSGLTQSLIGTISPTGAVTAHIASTGTPVAGNFSLPSPSELMGALGVPQPVSILNEAFTLRSNKGPTT